MTEKSKRGRTREKRGGNNNFFFRLEIHEVRNGRFDLQFCILDERESTQ